MMLLRSNASAADRMPRPHHGHDTTFQGLGDGRTRIATLSLPQSLKCGEAPACVKACNFLADRLMAQITRLRRVAVPKASVST